MDIAFSRKHLESFPIREKSFFREDRNFAGRRVKAQIKYSQINAGILFSN